LADVAVVALNFAGKWPEAVTGGSVGLGGGRGGGGRIHGRDLAGGGAVRRAHVWKEETTK
jgi:hypothetical protein